LCQIGTSPLVDLTMNVKSLRCHLFVVLIFLLCLVAACTTDQLATKENKPTGPLTAEERSRQEEETQTHGALDRRGKIPPGGGNPGP
jgi:hypothetical protein